MGNSGFRIFYVTKYKIIKIKLVYFVYRYKENNWEIINKDSM